LILMFWSYEMIEFAPMRSDVVRNLMLNCAPGGKQLIFPVIASVTFH